MKNLVYISMKGICYQPEGRQCWCHPSCHRCAGSQRAFDQLWSQSWDGKHKQIMFGVYSFSCVRQFLPVKIPPVHCYLWKVLPSDYYRYYSTTCLLLILVKRFTCGKGWSTTCTSPPQFCRACLQIQFLMLSSLHWKARKLSKSQAL